MLRTILSAALMTLVLGAAPRAAEPAEAGADALKPMLRSDSLVFNGITRAKDGRLFSPFQRQEKGEGIELGEWVDGVPKAYPSAAWNAWALGDDPVKAFVAVNAIRIGPDGDLWVIDKGASEMNATPYVGGPKLVQIDLANDTVRRVYPLQAAVRPKSFFDDFRFNGRTVYITDAGSPGIAVLNLDDGQMRRVLEDLPSTTAQRPLTGEGHTLADPQGRPIYIHADQLEVSPDGKVFYYQPCVGPLYRIETRYLDDAGMPDAERARHVAVHAQVGSTGGTAIDAAGTIYASDTDGLRVLAIAPDGTTRTLVQDPHLVWVDAMWIDEQGGLWLPAAQMNRTMIMNGGRTNVAFPTTIYRMDIGARPLRN